MSDLEVLVAVVGLFYLYESAFWVRPGCLLLAAQLPGRTARLRRTALLQNDHGSLLFGNLLPLGHSVLVQPWPFSVSPQAMVAYAAAAPFAERRAPRSGRLVPFDEVRTITADGRHVRVNGIPFVEAGSPPLARHLADTLKRLADVPEGVRAAAINDALKQSMDADRAALRFQEFRRHSRGLLVSCLTFFVYVFLLLPGLVRFAVPVPLWIALPLVLPQVLWIVAVYWRAYRALHPGAESGRWRHLGIMLLSPADAMHARDTLFADVLGAFHPLAAAAILCPWPVFEELAGQVVRDQRHPLPPPCPPDASELARSTEAWFRTQLDRAIAALLRRAGVDAEQFTAVPVPEDDRCRSYCPRCLGQHELRTGTCTCCGCALRSFADEVVAEPAAPPRDGNAAASGNSLTRSGAGVDAPSGQVQK